MTLLVADLEGRVSVERWPFAEPQNTAVITLRPILAGKAEILRVRHDEDDGTWQFLGWQTPSEEEALVVSLRRVYERDPSIGELHDLPLGWRAWRRTREDRWIREVKPAQGIDTP